MIIIMTGANCIGASEESGNSPSELTDAVKASAGSTEITEKPEEITITLPGEVPLIMVKISAGKFSMGGRQEDQTRWYDECYHQVTLTKGFELGKYELTKRQWLAVMGTKPWSEEKKPFDDPESPVTNVLQENAQEFVIKLNKYIEDTEQGSATMRLPTEAEWEYACRAGTTTRFYWGDDWTYAQINDYAWWKNNTVAVDNLHANIVGQKLPNPFGLYDMSGNVREWCQDWYGIIHRENAIDPKGPESGIHPVVRGGSWRSEGHSCRSSYRWVNHYPPYTNDFTGFRLAR